MKTIDQFRTTWTWTIIEEDVEAMAAIHAKYGSCLLVVGRESDAKYGHYTIRRSIGRNGIVDIRVVVSSRYDDPQHTREVEELERVVISK